MRRSGPLRTPATVYRRSDPEARRPPPRTGGPIASSEDVVIQAVKLGYKIADEQIAKGQEFARKLRGASSRSDGGDFGELVEQGVRLAKQIGILLVELAETTTQPQAVLRSLVRQESSREPDASSSERRARAPAPDAEPSRARARCAATHTVPIEVLSSRPTRVSLELDEPLRECPDVYPLYLKGDPAHALHDVSFKPDDGRGFVLSVVVRSENPAGNYRGYAIDPVTQRPLGTIRVVVSDAAASASRA
ncbi:MAG TPA: hypothetical protein VMI54_06025 [Polyangiaceae bacterium]|nr:hypothetical protein [Polyangiaceae bacterium]